MLILSSSLLHGVLQIRGSSLNLYHTELKKEATMAEIKHLKNEDYTTTKWSGGSTTQLYIHPIPANYSERDFDFRLSTATVDIEQSVFTSLPGIQRELMILDGSMQVVHNGHYSVTLQPYDIDSFQGDWSTKGFGRCVDFNLMTRLPYSGKLRILKIKNKQQVWIDKKVFCQAWYCIDDELDVTIGTEKLHLEKGDLVLVFLNSKECEPIFETPKSANLVSIEILKN